MFDYHTIVRVELNIQQLLAARQGVEGESRLVQMYPIHPKTGQLRTVRFQVSVIGLGGNQLVETSFQAVVC